MSEQVSDSKKSKKTEDLQLLAEKAGEAAWIVGKEFWKGVITNTIPWTVYAASSAIAFICSQRFDALVWRLCHGARFYPFHALLYWPYVTILTFGPLALWSIARVGLRRKLVTQLTAAFRDAGLETRTKRVPGFISDFEIDANTRKLTLATRGLTKADFEQAQKGLETSLQVFIDEIDHHTELGTVEIIYCHQPMPKELPYESDSIKNPFTFLLGTTHTKRLYVSLREVPHILIAGLTISGKSTFLRQILLTLMLKNRGTEFTLIDLKEGNELTVFNRCPNVKIYITPHAALEALKYVEGQLDKRLALLAANRCNNIDAFHKITEEKRVYPATWPKGKAFVRHIAAIDEAAQLFIAGSVLSSKEVQTAKRLAFRIGALGRSVGVHLIIATQRPDRQAVDPLIKTNMNGRLCFQMADNASSMTILDSVRAADLPRSPGRAIWRAGLDLTEVQTPKLDREDMGPHLLALRPEEEQPGEGAKVESAEPQKEPGTSTAARPKDEINAHDETNIATGATETISDDSDEIIGSDEVSE